MNKTNEVNNYFITEIDQNELFRNFNKNSCTTLSYTEHFLTLVFAVTVCICISSFPSLVDISKRIMSSTIRSNICAIIASIKKYKSIIKKKKKNRIELALLAKTNLDYIKGWISWSLIESYIKRDYSLLIEALREYDGIKEKLSKPGTL